MARPLARRAFAAFVVVTPVLLLGAPSGAAPIQAAPSETPGTAQAIAELVQIDPAVGNLALTMRVGTSIAGHQNIGASSEARSVDLGFIGDILAGEGCDGGDPTIPPGTLPESVIASSADPAAADGYTGGVDGVVTARARADSFPSADADAQLDPLGVPGLAEIVGGRSEASSTAAGHLARAVTEIGRIDIAGGLVSLRGMRWEATSQLLPERVTTTDFSVGSLVVGGTPVALPAGDALSAIQAATDPVLGPLGIELSFPEVVEHDAGIELTPFTVGVVPGELRDGILGPVLGALQPARASIDEFLLDLDCGNATYLTVLDVIVGAVTGAGYASVDLGGVIARSDEVTFTSLLGGVPTPPPAAAPPPPTTGTPAPVSTPSTGAFAADDGAGAATVPSNVEPLPTDDEQAASVLVGGTRGGPLVLVGLAGLLAMGVAAGLDRHRMRKAQKSVPLPPG